MEKDWPPDPLLDEIEEARMRILAEHGGDYRKPVSYTHLTLPTIYSV